MRVFCAVWLVSMMACLALKAGEFSREQLIDGFISYLQKAEGIALDGETKAAMRKELDKGKADPMLAPYVFNGEKMDREALVKATTEDIQKWKAAGLDLTRSAQYASDVKNLQALSDVELVMAFRLINQMAERLEPKDK